MSIDTSLPPIAAMERAALDRSDKGDALGFVEISDPDVVYFDPFLEAPIHGREALRAYYEKNFNIEEAGTGEMTNVRVQVAGDAAVLTFNYTITVPSGRPTQPWNTTEVYRRTGDGWRIVHTHWSFRQPQLAKPAQ